jgi:ribose transport system substrate-binding protein
VRRRRSLLALAAVLLLLATPGLGIAAQDATPAADASGIEIAFLLSGRNAFTERMETGAEDAARDHGVTVEVFGDPSFDVATHQAFLEAALEGDFEGIVIATNPGDEWIAQIQEAAEAGVRFVSTNVTGRQTGLETWVGQDEYNSGLLLGNALRGQLEAAGITEGTIAVGDCAPAATSLRERDAGLRQAFAGTNFGVLEAQVVWIPAAENYARWEAIMAANPDAVAAVGLCSVDIPNLARLKERTGATWLIGGYDLTPTILQAIKDGWAQVAVGQQEYLQGYLPVRALAEHLVDGTPLVTGWLEIPTEVVTADNADAYVARQTDDQVQHDYYREYMAEHFADLHAAARPLDDLRGPGPPATPTP